MTERTFLFEYDEYDALWKEHRELYEAEPDVYREDSRWYWELTCDQLSTALQEVQATDYWLVQVVNQGWQHRTGYTYVELNTHRAIGNSGEQMIHAILPKTDFTFSVHRSTTRYLEQERNCLVLIASHHDAQGEEYTLVPLSADEWEQENGA